MIFRSSTLILLFIFFLVSACSTPSWFPTQASWFPFKKKPPYKAKMKELLDKEVVIIDKEEYVKVLNPQASGGRDQPKYLYIPVNEYLVKKEIYVPITPTARKEESKKGSSMASKMPSPGLPAPEVIQVSPLLHKSLDLKKKVMVVRFDDRTEGADEDRKSVV